MNTEYKSGEVRSGGLNLDHFWMPFTPNGDFKKSPRLVSRADGAYYYDLEGKPVIDGSSGLFCVPLGHGRKEIAEAIYRQAQTLDYSSPFQMGHPGAFEAAEKLARILPNGLDRIFYTGSGSEAVDTAMKMAVAYHGKRGESSRNTFITRRKAYHGVNLGGTGLSGLMRNRQVFHGITGPVYHLPETLTGKERFKPGQPELGAELADEIENIALTVGAGNIAGVFIEPIAGSTGVLVPPLGYLERVRELCDRHGILLIFDEVITGFYRTGKAFASQTFGVKPDLMTLAKGISNGCVPMGAVACETEIYETLVDGESGEDIEFFHGYTFSAHPLACAASIASLELFESEDVEAKVADLAPYFSQKLHALHALSRVKDLRSHGLLGGVELHPLDGRPGKAGVRATKLLFQAGLHVKFTGDTGIVAPPLICGKRHVDEIFSKLETVLDSLK